MGLSAIVCGLLLCLDSATSDASALARPLVAPQVIAAIKDTPVSDESVWTCTAAVIPTGPAMNLHDPPLKAGWGSTGTSLEHQDVTLALLASKPGRYDPGFQTL